MVFKCKNRKYASDKSVHDLLEIWFIKDHQKAIKIRLFNTFIKFTTCVLYIVQVLMESPSNEDKIFTKSFLLNSTDTEYIHWPFIGYMDRHPVVRYMQLILATYGFIEALFYFYLNYNEKFITKIFNPYFLVEMVCTVPWFFEIVIPQAKNVFIPVFLNCWLVKKNIDTIFKHYNHLNLRNSLIGQKLVSLVLLLTSLIFTCMCGFQHLQRASLDNQIELVDAFYFTIITFSTVGYGDKTPDFWLSKLFVAIMIIISIVILPAKIENIATLWIEKKNSGGSYSSQLSENKHVVVCMNKLEHDFIVHFLREFYGHRKNQSIHTILLATSDLNSKLKQLFNSPLWYGKIYYIHGSVMRDTDLERAKVHKAKAVFIISPRGGMDRDLEDQHTILRSWAIKDFAPDVPQFVQLFRMENKMHLGYVENLVCEEEMKYAILASNCLCSGISTLVTLLMHKATPKENGINQEEWQELYGKLAGNELHSIVAEHSKFFQEFIGKPFPVASVICHEKYNILLVAIGTRLKKYKRSDNFSGLQLNQSFKQPQQQQQDYNNKYLDYSVIINPGLDYNIGAEDLCIYISIFKEEKYDWKYVKVNQTTVSDLSESVLNGPDLSSRGLRPRTIDTNGVLKKSSSQTTVVSKNFDYCVTTHGLEDLDEYKDIEEAELIIARPPNPLYVGCFPIKCKLLKEPKSICCMRLDQSCEHREHTIKTSDYLWHNKCIILVAEQATNGLFNFLLPLRAKARSTNRLKPIILLLSNHPSPDFLESVSCFPLVFWLEGSLNDINNLLKGGILHSDALVVVSNETQEELEDESLYDSSNIFAIQNIYRLFPRVKVISELRKASNIRFMKFRGKDMEKEKSSKLMYMYRTPFASGNVFSASMIDTLLYQAFGKPYLIEFFRLLIGISQTEGSGNLTSIPLKEEDMWLKTYGNLYKKLAFSTGEIAIGIYRTLEKGTNKEFFYQACDQERLILTKLQKLKMNTDVYNREFFNSSKSKVSYVLINPSSDFELNKNDVIYLLKPGKII